MRLTIDKKASKFDDSKLRSNNNAHIVLCEVDGHIWWPFYEKTEKIDSSKEQFREVATVYIYIC